MYLLAFILFYGCKMFIYLAILTGSSISISITYILFLTEMQKRQILLSEAYLFVKYIKLLSSYMRFRMVEAVLTTTIGFIN
jgi:hypothetical protein